MNILKLAKHLKEFILDEIEMIAEVDCKTELERLLNEGKIAFEQGVYKSIEKVETIDYGIFSQDSISDEPLPIEIAVKYFLKNYVKIFCKKETVHQYKTIFKVHILTYFKNKSLNELQNYNILEFYEFCKTRELQPRRIKNILALLNQLIKYFQNLGIIEKRCNFQIRRLTDKNQFGLDRIIFEELKSVIKTNRASNS